MYSYVRKKYLFMTGFELAILAFYTILIFIILCVRVCNLIFEVKT